jgi:D-alanine transaminase
MPRIAYVNGAYVPHRSASVHIEDRGYQFADGVYEVVHAYRGRLIDEVAHLDRLERSLKELSIAPPMARQAMRVVMREVVRRNRVTTGLLYIQVTRGEAPRDHKFPQSVRPALVMTARSTLPNILAKQTAAEAQAYEAWMVEAGGNITEGSSSNAWIVTGDNVLVTPPLGHRVLAGTARQKLLNLATDLGVSVEERPFSVSEACQAKEAFMSNSSHFVTPVTQIDDTVIANGKPGSLTVALHERYIQFMEDSPSLDSLVG